MKKSVQFLLVILGFLVTSFTSQQTIWLDKDLKETSQEKAVYYKIGSKLEGAVSYYYKDRTVYRKVLFVDGKLNGKFNEFYKSGELREDGKYNNGSKDGNWKTYYKNGKIKSRGRYKNGEKVGIWKFFYKND
jgi:antitoxin component YwqK of YwqJK toxin-antitoxin module